LTNQPDSQGLTEGSRGSKRSAASRNRSIKDSHTEGAPAQFCDPFRIKIRLLSGPGGSLRSTSGYISQPYGLPPSYAANVIT